MTGHFPKFKMWACRCRCGGGLSLVKRADYRRSVRVWSCVVQARAEDRMTSSRPICWNDRGPVWRGCGTSTSCGYGTFKHTDSHTQAPTQTCTSSFQRVNSVMENDSILTLPHCLTQLNKSLCFHWIVYLQKLTIAHSHVSCRYLSNSTKTLSEVVTSLEAMQSIKLLSVQFQSIRQKSCAGTERYHACSLINNELLNDVEGFFANAWKRALTSG